VEIKMNTGTLTANRFPFYRIRPDVLLFSILLIILNTHILTGNYTTSFFFFPDSVQSGEWWRLLTHPFVHLSWYHLLLDAGAFFLLYKEIQHKKMREKFFYVVLCGIVSLGVAIIASPLIETRGLTGLSGIAHGLMAVSALEMIRKKEDLRVGLLCFLIVVSKSIYEALSGHVLFEFMHMGMCGTPVAASHAGGVLGGIVAFSLVNKLRK
jgi:rhomboid family GlyGly-CTERM serine protease